MNELRQCRKTNPHVTRSSDNIEWYTPAQHIEAARGVMGGIVLDPASCEAVNRVVNAARIYTIQNDSRSQPWASQVWFDPAYARQLIGGFDTKLCDHFGAGDVTEAIVLANNANDTSLVSAPVAIRRGSCLYKQARAILA